MERGTSCYQKACFNHQIGKEASMSAAGRAELVIVKRYARSRFYDTAGQRYVTVEQLRTNAMSRLSSFEAGLPEA